MTSSRRVLAAIFALTLATHALAANPSAQDFATARALYKEGKDLRAAGDLKGAFEKLTAAHTLGRTPLTGIELARVEVQLGLLVEARETCLGIARLSVEPDETSRSADARKDAAQLADELRPRISSLRVKITSPGNASVVVAIDGVNVPEVALAESHKVNPGHHVVTAHVDGGTSVSGSTDVAEGQSGEVSLAPPPPPVVVEKPKDKDPEKDREKPEKKGLGALVIAGISVTGGGLLLGAVGGIFAMFTTSDLNAACGNKQCPPSQYDKLDNARGAAVTSTIGFSLAGGGLVLLVVGLITHTTSSKESLRGVRILPDLGVDHVGVSGAF